MDSCIGSKGRDFSDTSSEDRVYSHDTSTDSDDAGNEDNFGDNEVPPFDLLECDEEGQEQLKVIFFLY